MLAAKGPQGAAHFAEEAITLVLIDAHDFVEQAEVIAAFAGDGAEGHYILREAGAAVADAGIQEARADARVGADAVADLINICADRFTDGCDRVDERNLHGEKCVGSMLDQFRALGAGDDDGSGNGGAVGLGNGISALVVAAAGERGVYLAEHIGGAFAVAADDDAVGKEKVGYGGAFTQKFGIGSDVERFRVGTVAQNDFANPFAGVDRDGAFFNDDFVLVDTAGDFAGDGIPRRKDRPHHDRWAVCRRRRR